MKLPQWWLGGNEPKTLHKFIKNELKTNIYPNEADGKWLYDSSIVLIDKNGHIRRAVVPQKQGGPPFIATFDFEQAAAWDAKGAKTGTDRTNVERTRNPAQPNHRQAARRTLRKLMKRNTTIALFYTGVAVVCIAIVSIALWLRRGSTLPIRHRSPSTPARNTAPQWFEISKDLAAVNQDNQPVKLSDLRGKVWIVAEFFAICPHCAVRNGEELRKIYDEFKDHPDFHITCISVDPENDKQEKLADYAKALSADTKNWWFLNAGDAKTTHEYLEKELKFFGIRERTDPLDIEANGRYRPRPRLHPGGPRFQGDRQVAARRRPLRGRQEARSRISIKNSRTSFSPASAWSLRKTKRPASDERRTQAMAHPPAAGGAFEKTRRRRVDSIRRGAAARRADAEDQDSAAGWLVHRLPAARSMPGSTPSPRWCCSFRVIFIKLGNVRMHRATMVFAMFLSVLFLLCYVAYHITNDRRRATAATGAHARRSISCCSSPTSSRRR